MGPAVLPKHPTPPTKLGPAGRGLWNRITRVLELDPAEVTLLTLACRQADDVARLEKALAEGAAMVAGSTGQTRLSPLFAEIRNGRLAILRLLAGIAVPDADGEPGQTAQSRRARHAANVRWIREANEVEVRG